MRSRTFAKRTAGMAICILALGSAMAESVLDVLILYTDDVEDRYNGIDGVLAQANASVASANQGFENSSVDIRLRLKGIEKIDYVESSENMNDDLNFITDSSYVASLRNELGADLVCLFRLVTVDNVVGVAWLLEDEAGKPERAFSVTTAGAALSSMVFQHEIGHNLGGAHDRENTESGGLYPFSHGHRFNGSDGAEYRTIMAYAPGKRINYFSNPSIEYLGTATGIAEGANAADNAHTFNGIASSVESYREHIHQLPVADAGPDLGKEDLDLDGYERVTLDAWRSSYEDHIVSWEWEWNGGFASGEKVTVEFPKGTTLVTLRITDSEGFVDEDELFVTVQERTPVVLVESGSNHSFFLKESGSLIGLGQRGLGELGRNTGGSVEDPVKVFSAGIESVSGGGQFTLYLRTDGSVWGSGVLRFSNGEAEYVFEPIQIFASGIAEIASGSGHGLFRGEDGSLWGAGVNHSGQLGDGTSDLKAEPIKILDTGVASIFAAGETSFFLKTDGSLWGMGLGVEGQLGNGNFGNRYLPVEIFPSGVASVASNRDQTFFLMENGSVWLAGRNWHGVLRDHESPGRRSEASNVPVQILYSGAIAVAADYEYGLILLEDGSLLVVGRNLFSAQGFPASDAAFSVPTKVIPGGVNGISAGVNHLMVMREDNSIWKLGDFGEQGPVLPPEEEPRSLTPKTMKRVQLGFGEWPNEPPIAVGGGELVSTDLDGNGFNTVKLVGSASTDDWQVVSYAWSWPGGSANGEVVRADFEVGSTTVTLEVKDDEGEVSRDTFDVRVNPQDKIEAVSTSDRHSIIMMPDGSLWGTGNSDLGQLGNGPLGNRSSFSPIMPSKVAKIATSSQTTLFLQSDGSLWGMGRDEYNALGTESGETNNLPIKFVESGVIQMAAGNDFTLYVRNNGTLWGMGNNAFGQIGLGSNQFSVSPAKEIDSEVSKVFTGARHSMFIKIDGSLWGMGNNDRGQLGDGTKQTRYHPARILSGGALSAALSENFSLVLKDDGSVWSAGDILPVGGIEGSGELVQLVESGAVAVAAGFSHYFVLMDDDSLHAAGYNTPGQLGNGLGEGPFELHKVLDDVVAIATSANHSLVIRKDGSLWGAGNDDYGQMGLGRQSSNYDLWTEVISIDPQGALRHWLRRYFTDAAIESFGENPDKADPDSDGISNESERLMGLDPRRPFDPWTEGQGRILKEEGSFILELNPFGSNLDHTLLGSSDLVEWEELDYPSVTSGDSLHFKLLDSELRFYRLRISMPK